jgi:hypothetical protein
LGLLMGTGHSPIRPQIGHNQPIGVKDIQIMKAFCLNHLNGNGIKGIAQMQAK